MHIVEFAMLNTKLTFVLKSDDALQGYRDLFIDFSGNFNSEVKI